MPKDNNPIASSIDRLSIEVSNLILTLKGQEMTRSEALLYAQHILEISNTLNSTAMIIVDSANKKEEKK